MVEGAALEKRCAGNRTGSSNLPLSARKVVVTLRLMTTFLVLVIARSPELRGMSPWYRPFSTEDHLMFFDRFKEPASILGRVLARIGVAL